DRRRAHVHLDVDARRSGRLSTTPRCRERARLPVLEPGGRLRHRGTLRRRRASAYALAFGCASLIGGPTQPGSSDAMRGFSFSARARKVSADARSPVRRYVREAVQNRTAETGGIASAFAIAALASSGR